MDDLKLYSKNEKVLDSLIQTVRVFSQDIRMEFGIDKCATIVLKRGKLVKSDGIKLPDGKEMKSLNEGDGYKYLGVTEADEIKKKEMKEKVGKEYKRRIRKILETKLSGENVMKGINTWGKERWLWLSGTGIKREINYSSTGTSNTNECD